jgi:hypothetical protein
MEKGTQNSSFMIPQINGHLFPSFPREDPFEFHLKDPWGSALQKDGCRARFNHSLDAFSSTKQVISGSSIHLAIKPHYEKSSVGKNILAMLSQSNLASFIVDI